LDDVKFQVSSDLSIIITTFEKRFFDYTIPLITNIRNSTNLPIFLIVNGNVRVSDHNSDLQRFVKCIGDFSNIFPTFLFRFHGCAEMWNIGITNSETKYFLILNDDVHIFQNKFKDFLNHFIPVLDKQHLVTINRSFSHFGLSRDCLENVGFFDEHFLGIGDEDRDYFYRFESAYKKIPFDFYSDVFYHFGEKSNDNSIFKATNSKYSEFNSLVKDKFYAEDSNSLVAGRYEIPMTRVKNFIDPRPIWNFRTENYNKMFEQD
jgi:hypothetical protein